MKSPSQFASPSDSPGFLLWRVSLRWQREVTAALRPLGLTHVQFVLLAVLWWVGPREDAPTQRELAQAAGTDPMMTSQVVRALEARGLVERRPDPYDRRVRRLVLTPEGHELAERGVQAVEGADARFFHPADGPALLPLLQALAAPDADDLTLAEEATHA